MAEKITAAMVMKVAARSAEYTKSPEAKLWLAVLGQFFRDYEDKIGVERKVFYSYVHTKDYQTICDWLGLNAENIARLVLKIGDRAKVGI